MRMPWGAASRFVLCVGACAACGGSQGASGGPKSAETSAVVAGPSPAAETSEPPTTTAALEDGGETSGTKLAESQPQAAAGGSAPAAGTSAGSAGGGRAHEPGRGAADIRAIIVAHREEARACYDKALADHPGIEGDLVINWTIDPKGSVSKIFLDTARSQITAPEVGACVVAIIQKLQFASSPGGYETRASYPFNFHPRRTSTHSAP